MIGKEWVLEPRKGESFFKTLYFAGQQDDRGLLSSESYIALQTLMDERPLYWLTAQIFAHS